MGGKRHHFYILIALAIVIGLGFGYKVHLDRVAASEGRANPDAILRVLSLKGLFPADLLRDFERDSGIRVIVSEVETPEALWDRFETPSEAFDLISLFSYQIPFAVQAVRLQPLDSSKARGLSLVSADFSDIPGELGNQRVLPLLWGATGLLYDSRKLTPAPSSWKDVLSHGRSRGKIGLLSSAIDLTRWMPEPQEGAEESEEALSADVIRRSVNQVLSVATLSSSPWSSLALVKQEGFAAVQMNHGETAFLPKEAASWKFVLPEEKAGFWILSLALTREAKAEREAYRFLDFMMEAESSARLARSTHQASTNRAIETLEIDSRLKPSYLRELALTRLHLLSDFRTARSIRGILGNVTASRSH